MNAREWPEWWEWELELSPHLLDRMEDRDFNELDLRLMLQELPATGRISWRGGGSCRVGMTDGDGTVIVEPDAETRLLVMVTAFPVWES